MLNYQNKQNNKQMKNTLKSVLTLALVAGLGFVANAQKTATAPASAVILADLTITLDGTQNEIAFGNVSASTPGSVVLDANGTNNSNTGSLTNVAQFALAGADVQVNVNYDATVNLVLTTAVDPALPTAAETIVMTPEVVGDALSTEQANAASIAIGGPVVLANNAYFIWVGGSFATLLNKGTGTYSGTFNIDVEYN